MRRYLALGLVPLGLFAVAKIFPATGGYSLAAVAPAIAPPPENGPVLRVTGASVTVRATASRNGQALGVLHTGARITRGEKPVGTDGCPEGWYAVRPSGAICAGDGVALDESRAVLPSVNLAPNKDAALPYAYVKTTAKTQMFLPGPVAGQRVADVPVGTWLAVAGQGQAIDPTGKAAKVVFTPQGQAISSYDVEPVRETAMKGTLVDDPKSMPIGYIVRDNVTPYRLADAKGPTPLMPIAKHTRLALTNKSHKRGSERFLGLEDGNYIRARDVTLIQKRETFPAFATEGVKWLDISVVTGTLVAYEGKKPVFATVVSLGSEKAKGTRPTQLGTFQVIGKQFTVPDVQPGAFDESRDVRDIPWVIELSSGQKIHAAIWHERFGLEFGPGNIQLAASDAAFLFKWVGGTIPEGWHGALFPEAERKVQVIVR
ncbi:MAG: L,D-transpeptidase [Polyangiaceae bacterium]